MNAESNFEPWDEWDDEEHEDELIDELAFEELDEEIDEEIDEELDDDELFEDDDPLASGPLRERTQWLQIRGSLDDMVGADDILDFHFFIEGTRGICKGERNFFNRMRLYFYK